MSYTVVQVNKSELLHGVEPLAVYSVRFGELFATHDHAQLFAQKLNASHAGTHWHHFPLPTDQAQAALAASGTFQI